MAVLLSVLLCTILVGVPLSGAAPYVPKAVIYWGQNSGNVERNLASYCTSGVYDMIVIGFSHLFPNAPNSQYPGLNFANHCDTYYDQSNPYLLICPSIGADIMTCQASGVKLVLSFGGGSGLYGISSDAQAITFATTVWNMFLGGNGSIRPFGSAVLDGIDLDVELGSAVGYAAFVNKLRTYYASAPKTYYITAAPQCVYPDLYLGPGVGTALQTAWFDFVWVQFYNNYCGLNHYSEGSFNFNQWANWATTISVNPNVRVLIGAPAGPSAAGSGYVPLNTLTSISNSVLSAYPNVYGGIMLWDCGNSDSNNNYGVQVSNLVHSQGGSQPIQTTSRPASTTKSLTTKATTTAASPLTTKAATTSPRTSSPLTTSRTVATSASVTSSALTTGKAIVTTSRTPVTSARASTTSRVATTSSNSCTEGYMKCMTSSSFATCEFGVWGDAQPCGAGTTCVQNGNYIYCG